MSSTGSAPISARQYRGPDGVRADRHEGGERSWGQIRVSAPGSTALESIALAPVERVERSEMKVKLTVTAGRHRGRAVEFSAHDTLVIGRSKDAQVRLPFGDDAL